MKKSVLLAIVGLSAGVVSSYGQGFVALDNYNSAQNPLITYGSTGGGTQGQGIAGAAWTVGIYFAQGTVANPSDPSGTEVPSALNPAFVLGTGTGSTAPLVAPGTFISSGNFQATADAVPGPVTFIVVAYNGADYASSAIRGHSSAFTMTPKLGTEFAPFLGDGMSTFAVNAAGVIPEPSTFALIGLGTGALLFLRRRKN